MRSCKTCIYHDTGCTFRYGALKYVCQASQYQFYVKDILINLDNVNIISYDSDMVFIRQAILS